MNPLEQKARTLYKKYTKNEPLDNQVEFARQAIYMPVLSIRIWAHAVLAEAGEPRCSKFLDQWSIDLPDAVLDKP